MPIPNSAFPLCRALMSSSRWIWNSLTRMPGKATEKFRTGSPEFTQEGKPVDVATLAPDVRRDVEQATETMRAMMLKNISSMPAESMGELRDTYVDAWSGVRRARRAVCAETLRGTGNVSARHERIERLVPERHRGGLDDPRPAVVEDEVHSE